MNVNVPRKCKNRSNSNSSCARRRRGYNNNCTIIDNDNNKNIFIPYYFSIYKSRQYQYKYIQRLHLILSSLYSRRSKSFTIYILKVILIIITSTGILLLIWITSNRGYRLDDIDTILSSIYNTNNIVIQRNSNNTIITNVTIHFPTVTDFLLIPQHWWDGNLLCDIIQPIMQVQYQQYQRQQYRTDNSNFIIPITINISIGCTDLYNHGIYGTGNYIAILYSIRFIAIIFDNIDIYMYCTDTETTKYSLIIPWLMGYYPSSQSSTGVESIRTISTSKRDNNHNNRVQQLQSIVSKSEVCFDYIDQPLAYMYREMQYELRSMAVALVGTTTRIPNNHPSNRFAQEYYSPTPAATRSSTTVDDKDQYIGSSSTKKSQINIHQMIQQLQSNTSNISYQQHSLLLPKYEYDDVIIHFRCGDYMTDANDWLPTMSFYDYVHHISYDAKSIGIVTQPFTIIPKETHKKVEGQEQQAQYRKDDILNQQIMDRCSIIVYSLVEYIQQYRRHARIRVYNDIIDETILLSYIRMIMANQTICGPKSSFGIFGTLATFGTAYIPKPVEWIHDIEMAIKFFTSSRNNQSRSNIVLFNPKNMVPFKYIKELWDTSVDGQQAVLDWYWTRTPDTDSNNILSTFLLQLKDFIYTYIY